MLTLHQSLTLFHRLSLTTQALRTCQINTQQSFSQGENTPQITRIPIHLQPIEKGLEQATKVMHHMKNVVRGKGTEAPILAIINLANYTLK